MYGSHLLSEQQQEESDLYDDLSLLIKAFKKIMILSYEIMERIQQPCVQQIISQLKELPSSSQRLVEDYNSQLEDNSPQKNTVHRFICRLYETISLYKTNSFNRSQASALYKEFLDKTQQVIKSYQSDRNIGKMFKKILSLTDRFCLSCEVIINNGFKEEILGYFCKSEDEQKKQASPTMRQLTRNVQSTRSESNFHKVMTILNRRFSTLSALDIDYNAFKTYFFQSRNQKQQLYKQYLQRNALIWKQINNYSKSFTEYLRKKEKNNINRKNRFKQKKENGTKNEGQNSKTRGQVRKYEERTQIQSPQKEFKEPQLPNLNRLYMKEDSPERRIDTFSFKDSEFRKTNFHIKNIYLTLNKVNQSQPSGIIDKQTKITIKKQNKQKNAPFNQYKAAKLCFKASKFNTEHEKLKYRPLLEIKHIQSRDYGLTLENQSLMTHEITNSSYIEDQKAFKGTKIDTSKKSISSKKNIRITQFLNKSSINSKVTIVDTIDDNLSLYHIRVLNCEEEGTFKT